MRASWGLSPQLEVCAEIGDLLFEEFNSKLHVKEFKIETVIVDGTHVVAIGHEAGTVLDSGEAFYVNSVQHFEVVDGRITKMTEYRIWIPQDSTPQPW